MEYHNAAIEKCLGIKQLMRGFNAKLFDLVINFLNELAVDGLFFGLDEVMVWLLSIVPHMAQLFKYFVSFHFRRI